MPYFVVATFANGRKDLRRSENGHEVFSSLDVAKAVRDRLAARISKVRPKRSPRNAARYLKAVTVHSFTSKVECEGFIAEHNLTLKGSQDGP